MISQSLLPTPALIKYVSSILAMEYSGGIPDFNIPLFANGAPTIVFQSVKSDHVVGDSGYLNLYGQTIAPSQLIFSGPVTLIAYFLHPHALKALFGIDANELTNRCIDLNDLKLIKEASLQEKLLNAPALNDRLALMDSLVLNLASANSFNDARLTFATHQLKNNNDPNALAEIQRELNITERTLQRMFEANIGVSPKMFKRVWQFHSAFQQLNQHQYARLTDIAYQHGFADQSHFIRVFKEFTNLTPKEYLQKAEPYNPKF